MKWKKIIFSSAGRARVGMVIILLATLTGYYLIAGLPFAKVIPTQEFIPENLQEGGTAKKSLQLKKFSLTAVTPTPVIVTQPLLSPIVIPPSPTIVVATSPSPAALLPPAVGLPPPPFGLPQQPGPDPCGPQGTRFCDPQCFPEAEGISVPGCKPIIYLYPEKETNITVTIETVGKIVVSKPLYNPPGWNVTAYPNGDIKYQEKIYPELFYETELPYVARPTTGIIVPINNLKPTLESVLNQLGFTEKETQAFVSYWVPSMERFYKPYIFFSLISETEKQRLDKVIITPKPDTFIEMLAYFKPLNYPEPVKPLILPKTPIREGFVAVEWGGIIGKE